MFQYHGSDGMPSGEELVRQLWERFDAGDFESVEDLLHRDFLVEWPQSRERIRGRANFIALNKAYPGHWRCVPRRIVRAGDLVVSVVEVAEENRIVWAISFFEVRDSLLVKATEYWGDAYEAPTCRSQWVERF